MCGIVAIKCKVATTVKSGIVAIKCMVTARVMCGIVAKITFSIDFKSKGSEYINSQVMQ